MDLHVWYQRAWAECPNGAWMLWALAHSNDSKPWSEDRKRLVAAALDCALLAHRWPSWETPHMLEAAEPLRLWALAGDQSTEGVARSRRQLFSAVAHPWVTNPIDAAYAVAYTVNVSGVAYAALCAGLADDDTAAQQCADVVRTHFRKARLPEAANLQRR